MVVEIYENTEFVLLPCLYSGFIPEDPTVMWTRNNLVPKSVHLHNKEKDHVNGQNQHYSGRTSMRPNALETGDFSVTLRNPQLTDSGTYTCTISDGRGEERLRDIQLKVKGKQLRSINQLPRKCSYVTRIISNYNYLQ